MQQQTQELDNSVHFHHTEMAHIGNKIDASLVWDNRVRLWNQIKQCEDGNCPSQI